MQHCSNSSAYPAKWKTILQKSEILYLAIPFCLYWRTDVLGDDNFIHSLEWCRMAIKTSVQRGLQRQSLSHRDEHGRDFHHRLGENWLLRDWGWPQGGHQLGVLWYWDVCMVDSIVTDTPQNGSPDTTKPSGAHHNHVGFLIVRNLTQNLTGSATYNLSAQRQKTAKQLRTSYQTFTLTLSAPNML